MVVAAVAPSASTGQRIDRVGFLVAGLLAGFGLTRLTSWLDPGAVAGLTPARAAGRVDGEGTAEVADGSERAGVAAPVERPVLFDHAAVDDVAALAPDVAPEPVVDADAGSPTPAPKPATTKGKRKGSSKAAKRAAAAEPVVAEPVVAEPVVAVEETPAAVSDAKAAETDAPAAEPAAVTDDVVAAPAAIDPVDTVDETDPAETAAPDEVDPVDMAGIAARTLASQLAPGTRIPSPALSALDSGRAPVRTTPTTKATDRVRPASDQPTAAPVRGTAPATSTARGRRMDTVPADDDRADTGRPTGDEAHADAAAGTDAAETSVVELLAKRAASTGSSVWSLAMNGSGGPASWALAPNAEAARKAAEDAVREALDNAGRADEDAPADAADRGTSPIVGRVPRRDR